MRQLTVVVESLETLRGISYASESVSSANGPYKHVKAAISDSFGRPTLSLLRRSFMVHLDFLRRHYETILEWLLHVYSSAIVFSPEGSLVRKANLDKLLVTALFADAFEIGEALPNWTTHLKQ